MRRVKIAQRGSLLEMTREGLVKRTRDWSEGRYLRRAGYFGRVVGYAGADEYINRGAISFLVEVGDYKSLVEIEGIKAIVDAKYPDRVPSRSEAQSIINAAISRNNIRVYCGCPDFKYRFHYVNTMLGTLPVGAPEEHRPPHITNPGENGILCKHLIAILVKPSKWTPKAITLVRDAVRYDRGQDKASEELYNHVASILKKVVKSHG
jgi:hypothetical protein